MMKQGNKMLIKDSVLGEISVTIKEVLGNIISYENALLNFSGMCHVSFFENMIVGGKR